MIRASDIKQQLACVREGSLSLNAFENWLEPYVWDMERDSSSDALELVYAIQLLFSERNERRLGASAMRSHLLALVNDAVLSIQFDENLNPALQASFSLSVARLFAPLEPRSQVVVLRPV